MIKKHSIDDLAIFSTVPLFKTTKSTSNLVRPDFEGFLNYSKVFFDKRHYTNNGPLVGLLEQRLAEFHQTQYCVTFCSGFWALVLGIKEIALKGKDEILMPSLTYRRMADMAAWTGLKPNFYEVDQGTLAGTAETVSQKINENTALILGVHPIVNCCDVDGLVKLADTSKIPIIFDSVESVYETVPSGKIGSFGEAEFFSMHASKFINGFEGGYATTNNPDLAEVLSLTRSFGFKGPDNVVVADGLNAKLNEIHAAMALAGLDDMEDQVLRNRERYYVYKDLLTSVPGVRLLEFDESNKTSYKNIVIELLDEWPLSRADTIDILNAENILARAYYSPPLHKKQMAYKYVSAELPLTDALSKRYVLFPCGHFVDAADIEQILEFMNFIASNSAQITERLSTRRLAENEQ